MRPEFANMVKEHEAELAKLDLEDFDEGSDVIDFDLGKSIPKPEL